MSCARRIFAYYFGKVGNVYLEVSRRIRMKLHILIIRLNSENQTAKELK